MSVRFLIGDAVKLFDCGRSGIAAGMVAVFGIGEHLSALHVDQKGRTTVHWHVPQPPLADLTGSKSDQDTLPGHRMHCNPVES